MSSNLFWLKYGKKRGTIILSNLNEIRGCLLTFLSPQTFLKKENLVLLPLLQTLMVILLLLFKLCDLTVVIFKRSSRLPLVNVFLPLF